jgi:hypothetical protein
VAAVEALETVAKVVRRKSHVVGSKNQVDALIQNAPTTIFQVQSKKNTNKIWSAESRANMAPSAGN